jgi:SecD/SecF fusion protein
MPLGLAILNDPLALFLSGLALLILFFWYFATEVDRRKRNVGSVLVLGVIALCALAVWPPDKTLKGGIDIVGGSAFTLRVQPNKDETGKEIPVSPDASQQAIKTIEKRLNTLGTKDLFIQRQGNDRIRVQMPGIEPDEAARVRTILERAAKLELKEVNLDGYNPGSDGRTLAERVQSGDEIVPGFKAFVHNYDDQDGNERTEMILLNRRTALDGSNVQTASPNAFDPTQIDIKLDREGEDKMIALTKDMAEGRDRIAIVLDGEVMSAPVVQSAPLGRQFVITGMSGYEESRNLSNALLNPLKNELLIEEERTVSPTLGNAVVQQGIWAGIVGLAITFCFVMIYYRLGGVIALVGLSLNILFLFGAMAMFGFTLTLPGIAGIILTIGMAVDANVLIYERLREEMAAGKSIRAAIEAAYEKAFSAIFDANITSLITALVLFWRASGTVKGFAVTLTVGLLASMFAALLVTRVMFRWGTDSGIIRGRISFLSLIPNNLELRLPRQAPDRGRALASAARQRPRRLSLEAPRRPRHRLYRRHPDLLPTRRHRGLGEGGEGLACRPQPRQAAVRAGGIVTRHR